MKKKILMIGILVLIVVGFILWVYLQDKERKDTTVELSEQKLMITSVETDVKGLEVEASIQYTEKGEPTLNLFFTNNAEEDMQLGEERIYFKDGKNWKRCQHEAGDASLPVGYPILCSETVEAALQMEPDSQVTNTQTREFALWKCYRSMDDLGDYQLELTIRGEEGEIGTVYVNWSQELKE